MQTSQPSVWARDHTIFGVCEALGEDFRFNPLFLRVPLAVLILVSPTAVVGAYAAAGVLVALSRWLVPDRSAAPLEAAVAPAPSAAEPAEAEMAMAA